MELGKKMAALAKPGAVFALYGGLGAGKTCWTKGFAQGLGVQDTVNSPTYTIVSEYDQFNHLDAYRLQGDDDFDAIGGPEIIGGKAISVIEWSERLPHSIPDTAIKIHIEVLEGNKRRFTW
jgi:tRNA threonylcarbamoyladenosine biosynthesis protein TsaE